MIYCTHALICEEQRCTFYHGVLPEHLGNTFAVQWSNKSDTAREWRRHWEYFTSVNLRYGWHIDCFYNKKYGGVSPVSGYIVNFSSINPEMSATDLLDLVSTYRIRHKDRHRGVR